MEKMIKTRRQSMTKTKDQQKQDQSIIHSVLLHLNLEKLRNARPLGLRTLGVQHEPHGTITTLFVRSGSLPVGGDGCQRVEGSWGASVLDGTAVGLLLLSGVKIVDPVRVSRESLGFCFFVERDADG